MAVVDHGSVIEHGTPYELKAALRGDRVEVVALDASDLSALATLVGAAAGAAPEVDANARRVSAPVTDRAAALTAVVLALDASGIGVEDVGLRRPTLNEVFLRLTGHADMATASSQFEEVRA